MKTKEWGTHSLTFTAKLLNDTSYNLKKSISGMGDSHP
jgi:hypothetical protein